MGEALTIAHRALQEASDMEMVEAMAYILGFFTIWGAVVGLTWAVDNWVIKPILGRTLINPEFWK
mgnify:CR=1 FL=1